MCFRGIDFVSMIFQLDFGIVLTICIWYILFFSFCNSYLGKKNPDACQHIIPSINKDMRKYSKMKMIIMKDNHCLKFTKIFHDCRNEGNLFFKQS